MIIKFFATIMRLLSNSVNSIISDFGTLKSTNAMSRKNKIVWLLIIFGVIYCLCSCSPIQRLNRLQKNHPYLFTAKTDTIYYSDTIEVSVSGVQLDTTFTLTDLKDTVHFERDQLKGKMWLENDQLHGKFLCDTIYVPVPFEVKIPYNKYEVQPPPPDPWLIKILKLPYLWYFLFVMLLIYLISKLTKP